MNSACYSVAIPRPSSKWLKKHARPLALVSLPFGSLEYFWWPENRSVIIKQSDGAWYTQDDGKILYSIEDLLDDEYYLQLDELFVFKNYTYRHGVLVPKDQHASFFNCEWSDYACDHRVIHASVGLRTIDHDTIIDLTELPPSTPVRHTRGSVEMPVAPARLPRSGIKKLRMKLPLEAYISDADSDADSDSGMPRLRIRL